MLYDAHGNEIKETLSVSQNINGRRVSAEPNDRDEYDVSRGLTPAKLDAIMIAANGGEPAEQSRLCLEVVEKNWDISPAVETRRNAVMGVEWEIEPGGKSASDKLAAEKFKEALDNAGGLNGLDSFNSLLADFQSALLPGFSVSEIVWKEGGGIAGFEFIEQKHFTFRHGSDPYLVTSNEYDGIALEQNKFMVHRYRRRGSDVTRGGLIRPLAWLHCFQNLNVKDLLSFVERYGMPFVVAKVDDQTWEKERGVMQRLIRNFGPSGGGLFTKSVEFELLQAANNGGDVYFKLLEYTGAAITKIILGQTATSSDGGGLSGDNAQSDVRQDILEADCDALEDTVNIQLAAPWTMFNMPAGTAPPCFKMLCTPPEDKKANAETNKLEAETVKALHEAGYETDPVEMSDKFGMKLTRAKTPPAPNKNNTMSMAAELSDKKSSQRSEGANITKPTDRLVDNTAAEIINSGAANAWLGPIEKEISKLSELPDEELTKKLKELSGDPLNKIWDSLLSENFQTLLENETFAAAAEGIMKKTKELKAKNE